MITGRVISGRYVGLVVVYVPSEAIRKAIRKANIVSPASWRFSDVLD